MSPHHSHKTSKQFPGPYPLHTNSSAPWRAAAVVSTGKDRSTALHIFYLRVQGEMKHLASSPRGQERLPRVTGTCEQCHAESTPLRCPTQVLGQTEGCQGRKNSCGLF